MNHESIARVQRSHDALSARAVDLSSRFYDRFFAADPGVRRLFPDDLTRQRAHFDAALAMVVRNLDDVQVLSASLRDLGAQHLKWGAQPHHYFAVREALVAALNELSGDDWSAALEQDWRDAIGTVASFMLQGAAIETATAAEAIRPENHA
jgi:hemoglobin-like flavoprotein